MKFKDGRAPLRIVPRAPNSTVTERLEEAISSARRIGATGFAVVLEGPNGWISTDFKTDDVFRLVGALEHMKADLLVPKVIDE